MRDARNHYPQIKHHTPPPKQGDNSNRLAPNGTRTAGNPNLRRARVPLGLLSQSPIVCLAASPERPKNVCCCTRPASTTEVEPSNESPDAQLIPQFTGPAQVSWCSLERR